MAEIEKFYDEAFFSRQEAGSSRSARAILGIVFDWLNPQTLVDVGCGVGTWLAAAKDLGVKTIIGLDGKYVLQRNLHIERDEFIELDLETESIAPSILKNSRKFDLALCLEVAEHLSYGRARSFIQELTQLSDVMLFSAAVPYQAGTNHINEQWPEFWAILFASCDYEPFDLIRDRVWYDASVEWWYRQNTILFAKRGSPGHRRLSDLVRTESSPVRLSCVHPENLLFQVLHAYRSHRSAARLEETEDLKSIFEAYTNHAAEIPELQAIKRALDNPDAADVFPGTRMNAIVPEDVIRDLRTEVAGLKELFRLREEQLEETRNILNSRSEELNHLQLIIDQRDALIQKMNGYFRENALIPPNF